MMNDILNNSNISYDTLKNPPAFFWPSFMWIWNKKLDNAEIRKCLEEFKEMGSKTIWTLPISLDFANEVPTTLDKEFLSDDFFEVFNKFLDDTEELGLVNWITDEPAYPSGSLCGKLVKENPEISLKYLALSEFESEAPYNVPDNALIAFSNGKSYKKGETVPKGNISLVLICDFPDGAWLKPYPDILQKKSVDLYIEKCYEKYKEHIGDRFGKSVIAVFNDEANYIILPPWNDELEPKFFERYGYSLTENILAIFRRGDNEAECKVRVDFADMWSDIISENFFGRLKKWCNDNGLLFIGHLNGDHQSNASAIYGMGSTFKCMRKFDIPGVDVIWRQLYPDGNRHIKADFGGGVVYEYPDNMPDKDHHFPKFASSVAHQGKYPYALSESFAIYGSGITFTLMKKLVDYQYVRGINLLTMSCSFLDKTGKSIVNARPNFHSGNPTFNNMKPFQEYTARLSYLLSRGRSVAESCLYFPIRDLWAKSDDYDKVIAENDAFAEKLINNRIEFDFVDDGAIEEATVVDGRLAVGNMKYKRIFITHTEYMSKASKKMLEDFERAGGEIIFCNAEADVDLSLSCCKVKSLNNNIKVLKRIIGSSELYFIVNEGSSSLEELEFEINLPCYSFSAEDCSFKKLTVKQNGRKTTLTHHFDNWESLVLLFTDEAVSFIEKVPFENKVIAEITDCTLQKVESYVITENEILRTKVTEDTISAEFGDWQKYLGNDFSGTAKYTFAFNADADSAKKARIIDLSSLANHCKLYLNGEFVSEKAWAPFVFDIEGKLKVGENVFEAYVTNTLANQYVTTKALDGYTEGIGPYHAIAREFEKQDTASGIFKNPLIKY